MEDKGTDDYRGDTSFSPITNTRYSLPQNDDSEAINAFLTKQGGRRIVAVQGLGFVGTAMSLVVANTNSCEAYSVIGVDLPLPGSFWKIADINNGKCPISSSDPKVNQYFKNCRAAGNLLATHDSSAFQHADVIIVDINLDVQKTKAQTGTLADSSVAMDGFKSAISQIGKYCKPSALILVETTVPPGACHKIVRPILQVELSKRGLSDEELCIAHSYERVMPGPNYIDSIQNFYRVYSGLDRASADKAESFLKSVISTANYPLTRLKNTQSTEMAKVLENSYRAMNISFMVEWSRFAEKSGVDIYEVVSAIRQRPTHANLMLPGIGVGGYCLTKDPLLANWASQEYFGLEEGLPCSVRAVEINDSMPSLAYQFFRSCIGDLDIESTKVGLLGVSYAPGIGDTRFSPVQVFASLLLEAGAEVVCHDPYIEYWEEMNLTVMNSLDSFFDASPDVLVVSTGHRFYLQEDLIYEALRRLKGSAFVIDLVGLLEEAKMPPRFSLGNNFCVLGVGN